MHFIFHPQRSDKQLQISIAKDVLILNGESFDFSALPEGGVLPPSGIRSEFFAGPVRRENGKITVELILPHGALAEEPRRFPVTRSQNFDGYVQLPFDASIRS